MLLFHFSDLKSNYPYFIHTLLILKILLFVKNQELKSSLIQKVIISNLSINYAGFSVICYWVYGSVLGHPGYLSG